MLSTPAAQDLPVALAPHVWRDMRWVGSIAGHATTPDLLAGATSSAEKRRSVTRIYASACADLAQATLGGLLPRSAEWERWFAGLRSAARELSPGHHNTQVVQRALVHGARLESSDASWAHQLRRGFSALLAASLPEPVPALIGEDLDTFRAADARWLAYQSESSYSDDTSSQSLAEPGASREIPLEATRWPLRHLRPNPLNPRGELDSTGIDELAASITAHAAQGGNPPSARGGRAVAPAPRACRDDTSRCPNASGDMSPGRRPAGCGPDCTRRTEPASCLCGNSDGCGG